MGGETRFAYFPAATVSDGTATAVSVQATADPTITQTGGERTAVAPPLKRHKVSHLLRITLFFVVCLFKSRPVLRDDEPP